MSPAPSPRVSVLYLRLEVKKKLGEEPVCESSFSSLFEIATLFHATANLIRLTYMVAVSVLYLRLISFTTL